MKEQDFIMTDNWKDKKQMKICSPSQSPSSTILSKSRFSTKLKKGPIGQNLLITTGSNGQKSMEVDTISLTSNSVSSKTSSQGNQLLPAFACARIAAVVSNKKLKGEKETMEISNGRTWKYANNFKPEPRRPIHPDLTETTALSEPEEASNSSSTDSQKESEEMEKYAVCPKCGNLSADFKKCDSCHAAFSTNTKTYTRLRFKEADILKRKVPLASAVSQQVPESLIRKQSFYSNNKFQEQYQVYANGSFSATPSNYKVVVTTINPICPKSRMSKTRSQEPECLTISSDEEEHNMSEKGTSTIDSSNLGITKIDQRECCLPDSTTGTENENSLTGGKSLSSFEEDSMDSQSSEKEVEKTGQKSPIFLKCRSIRIGSFKVQPTAGFSIAVSISTQDMCFHVPTVINCNEIVTVLLKQDDILRVLGHFGYSLPVLYVYTTPSCGCVIRNQLQMNGQNGPFYDPCGADETQKRITILPETISNCQRTFLRQVFPAKLLQEIDQKNANEILVRSTPHTYLMKTSIPASIITRSLVTQSATPKQPVSKLLTYPPPPQTGGITITTEDLVCLKSGEFLNDVIIDFYLKYLVMEKLSPADRQRTHVFSSFFYPRLTQKTNNRTIADDDSSLTPQAKRHSQVKTWTRHVDIFEKDFIIIPINQNSHWFLAIICFPGLVLKGKSSSTNITDATAGEMEPSPSPSPSLSPAPSPSQRTNQASSPITARFNNQGYVPTDDDCQTFSKAESENESIADSESSMPQAMKDVSMQENNEDPFSENAELCESSVEDTVKEEGLEKEPCIMIFDSLAGPSRWRIVGTLREYLTVEWQTKKGTRHTFDRETMRGYTPRVPQQNNYSDCGVYVLQYVESFFKTPLQKFSSPLPNLEDWFTEEIAMQKREELRSLILELQKRQAASNNSSTSAECMDSMPTSTVCFQGDENEQR